MLGAVAQVTERAELMTYVTCPTMRYHPAVVAQQAATLALLSGDRFTLGLGAGENLNEHVIGDGWPGRGPAPGDAHRGGEHHPGPCWTAVNQLQGSHFRVDAAGIWTCPTVQCRSASRCRTAVV